MLKCRDKGTLPSGCDGSKYRYVLGTSMPRTWSIGQIGGTTVSPSGGRSGTTLQGCAVRLNPLPLTGGQANPNKSCPCRQCLKPPASCIDADRQHTMHQQRMVGEGKLFLHPSPTPQTDCVGRFRRKSTNKYCINLAKRKMIEIRALRSASEASRAARMVILEPNISTHTKSGP